MNGARTGGRSPYPAGLPLTRKDLFRARSAYHAEVAILTTPGAAEQRPAAATPRKAGPLTLVSGLSWPQVSPELGTK